MKSEEIQQLLTALKGLSITDSHVLSPLQKIRNKAMATKGGVQRLAKLACVPCLLKLLYHYVSRDNTETEPEKVTSEGKVAVALSIVSNLLMDRVVRQQVKRDGMETLVTLLTDCASEEVHIRCCRSLGNLAMDSPSRQVIAEAKAVPALLKILEIQYVEVKKSDNPEASAAGSKQEASDSDEEMEVEAKFPSAALVEAACRVVRYIKEDSKVRQQLVEAGIVAPLSMLIKSEEPKLVACVLRTLSELWTKMSKRITERMANEVSRAGIMSKLMDLIDSEDDTISHQAFTVLLPLAGHPHSAALIGASDGVNFFYSHLDSPRRHIVSLDLISGLCQLSKEAVNRVKMREMGVLKVLLDALKDDQKTQVQDRIISCLVNFLYDDVSLSAMLEGGLVDTLLSHLQRCGGYTSDLSLGLNNDAEKLFQTDKNDHHSKSSKTEAMLETERACILKQDSSDKITFPKTSLNDQQGMLETEEEESSGRDTEGENPATKNDEDGEEEKWSEMESNLEAAPRQTYSMNSPTYQAESTWHMEDYHPGVTCKSYRTSLSPTSRTNYSEDSGSPPHDPYSPLSTLSYYSPSRSSHLSPTHSSPASSPAYSYTTLSPVHSLCDSPPASPQSCAELKPALLSPLSPLQRAVSPEWERSTSPSPTTLQGLAEQVLVFSSSEDEEKDSAQEQPQSTERSIILYDVAVSGKTSPALKAFTTFSKGAVPPVAEVESMDFEFDSCSGSKMSHQGESANEVSMWIPDLPSSASGAGKRKLVEEASHQSEESARSCGQTVLLDKRFFRMSKSSQKGESKVEFSTKRAKVHGQQRHEDYSSTTQNNILIVLSRLSVCDDLSKYLATSKVITCLTDHLAFAKEPQNRCERILSRILCSPHCLTSLLTMCAPAILVKTFMLDSDSVLISSSTTLSEKGGLIRTSGSHFSRQASIELDMKSLMMMNAESAWSKPAEVRQTLRQRQGEVHSESSTSSMPSAQTDSTSTTSRKQNGIKNSSAHSEKPDHHEAGSSDSKSGTMSKKHPENLVRVGTQLLGDLSNQAMSPYGEGVISYTFHCQPAHIQLFFAASLLFLQANWPRERRQKFLFQKGALDMVLTALQIHSDSSAAIKDVLVLGIVFLSHSLVLLPKFQPGDVRRLFQEAVDTLQSGNCQAQDSKPQGSEVEVERSRQDQRSCQYSEAAKDLQLLVGRGRSTKIIWANRDQLVTNSSVFAAMLRGSYIESTLSQVSISDVSAQALTFILHFLHGCDEQCAVLMSAEKGEGDLTDDLSEGSFLGKSVQGCSSKQHLKHMLNLIAVADRFLLPELVQYLSAVVSTSLSQGQEEEVLRFAMFHSLSELAEDALKNLLTSSHSVAGIASCLVNLVESPSGSELSEVLLSLFRQGVMNTS